MKNRSTGGPQPRPAPPAPAPSEAAHQLPELPPHLRVLHGGGGAVHPERRELPKNLEAETAVLGALLVAGVPLVKCVASEVDAEDYHHPAHGPIYSALLALYRENVPIDQVTVLTQLRAMDQDHHLKFVGGAEYLAQLMGGMHAPDPPHVIHHAKLIRGAALQRRLLEAAESIRTRAHDPDVESSTAKILSQLREIERRIPRKKLDLFDPERFERRGMKALTRPIPPKLATGIAPLDEALGGGISAGRMAAIVAPPAFLKTAISFALIVRWLRAGENILYVTGEDSEGDTLARLISHESFGTAAPKFHGDVKYQQAQAAENFELIKWMKGKLSIISLPDEEMEDPPGIRWGDVLAMAAAQPRPPMVVVDYVEEMAGRVAGARGMTEAERNKLVVEQLKNYALRTRSRVLAIFSVNRGSYGAVDSPFRNPSAAPEDFQAVMKHSGYAEYAAGGIIALQYAGEDTTDDQGRPVKPMKLHLVKNREGGARGCTVPLLCYGGYCRFDLDTRPGADDSEAGPEPTDIRGQILHLLGQPEHRAGLTCEMIALTIRKREAVVRGVLREFVRDGEVFAYRVGRADLHQLKKYRSQVTLIDVSRTTGEGEKN